jgi:hypothetical protein
MYGLGAASSIPPVPAGYIDCGGGLSVIAGTPCPVIAPIDPTNPAVIQAQVDYSARGARCTAYKNQQNMIAVGAGAAAALLLPGWQKILGVVVWGVVTWNYPHSPDCDYGL